MQNVLQIFPFLREETKKYELNWENKQHYSIANNQTRETF